MLLSWVLRILNNFTFDILETITGDEKKMKVCDTMDLVLTVFCSVK
jgi:hypothetical protein